ncbi:hypothetical protein C8R43DRAFT_1233455 [Mycena crocata]|nr:hypothetical protein C8R43DRAFT_1233455 [Mycena crocata]
MSSVACQRYVWGLHGPVIGFVFSDNGVVGKLVLSWVDHATRTVHMVCPVDGTKTQPASPLGVFNFTNPTSVLRFSQLILNLAPHFAIISGHTINSCENNRLDWHRDNPEIAAGKFASGRDRVVRWIRDVETCCGQCPLSLPPTPTSSPPPEAFVHPPNDVMPSEKSGTKTQPEWTGKSEGKSSATSQREHKSSSDYADISIKGLDKVRAADVLYWTHDRVVQLGCVITTILDGNNKDAMKDCNDKIVQYNDMCGFRWFSSLDEKSCYVDAPLLDAKRSLVEHAVSLQFTALTPEHEQFLQERMPPLLSASLGAYTMHMQRSGLVVNEPECRHDWDALLYRFYCKNNESASPYVLLEQTIRYARNELVHLRAHTDIIEVQKNRIDRELDYCLLTATSAQLKRMADEVREQAQVAVRQAEKFKRILGPFLQEAGKSAESKEHFMQYLEGRAKKEPRTGICDALLFLAIKDKWNLISDARFTLDAIPPTKSPGTGTQADDFKIYLQNPFIVCTTESAQVPESYSTPNLKGKGPKLPSTPTASPVHYPFEGHLILPHVVVEYKKRSDTEGKALNQGRMYLVSLVAFYTALGIDDRPFYCIVTSGKIGAILMAWKSSKQKQTYLLERNVRKFDISIPLQAFQFATFLLRLRDDQEQLKKLVQKKLDAGVDDEFRERMRTWHKISQLTAEELAEMRKHRKVY